MQLIVDITGPGLDRQATPAELALIQPLIQQALTGRTGPAPTRGHVRPSAPMFLGKPDPLPTQEQVQARDPMRQVPAEKLNAITSIAAEILTVDPECAALIADGRLHDAVHLASKKAIAKYDQHSREVDEHLRRQVAAAQERAATPSEPEDVRIGKRAQELLAGDEGIRQIAASQGHNAGLKAAILKAHGEIAGSPSTGYLASA